MLNKIPMLMILTLSMVCALAGSAPAKEARPFINAISYDVPHVDPHKVGAAGEVWYYTNRAWRTGALPTCM